MIQTLIDKTDVFEQVRDRIAQILADETANQQALAVSEGKDPALWAFKVYLERSQPWEEWLNSAGNPVDFTPRVNVSYDNSTFSESTGNTTEYQQGVSTYYIDMCVATESTQEIDGHQPADKQAALEVQRILRLVRNILMASEYTYIFPDKGVVWRRWPRAMNVYDIDQPDTAYKIMAARFQLEVLFNEHSPQYQGVDLEQTVTTINRAEDGSVYATVQVDYSSGVP